MLKHGSVILHLLLSKILGFLTFASQLWISLFQMILAAKCAKIELQALEDFAATIFNYFKSNSAVFFSDYPQKVASLGQDATEKKEIFNSCWKQNHICLRSP